MSAGAKRLHGLAPEVSYDFDDYLKLIVKEDRPLLKKAVRQLVEDRDPFEITYRISVQGDNKIRYIQNHGVVRKTSEKGDRFFGIYRDVTHLKTSEQVARRNQDEARVLLKEVHHRIKNNLASLSGLLELQSYQIDDERAIKALKQSLSRIKAMANIHEAIYQSEDIKQLRLDDYLARLTQAIEETHSPEDKQIAVNLSVDPDIKIDFDRALNAALLINELMINAYQHAFPGRDEGQISIRARQSDGYIKLQVEDNGIGIDWDGWEKSDSLGKSLIESLSKQLGTNLDVEVNKGTRFSFSL